MPKLYYLKWITPAGLRTQFFTASDDTRAQAYLKEFKSYNPDIDVTMTDEEGNRIK